MISEDFHQTPRRINWKNIFLLIIFVLIAAAVAAGSYFSQKKTTYKSKASEIKNLQALPQTFPDIDPQTGEFYDLWLNTSVVTVTNTGGGPTYLAQTTFTLGGPRVSNTTTLYGIKQNSEEPYAPNQIDFTYNGGDWGRFTATANLVYSNCIDFHTAIPASTSNYIATVCYKNCNFSTFTNSGICYSPAANTSLFVNYNGTQATTLQFFSTAFNKYISKPEGYENGALMTRVNWFTYDSQHSNVTDFSNVVYTIQALTQGLTNQQRDQICFNPTSPQKYFKFTPEGLGPKPEGGSNFPVSDGSGCIYHLNSASLSERLWFASLYMDGGVPLPPPDAKVFVTSTTYNGNLGGLTGADEKCQARAQAAGLSGVYRAWLSDANNDAINRINENKYILVNGRVLAFNKTDLTDGVLSHAINKDEYGNIVNSWPTYVWTGTENSGIKRNNTCDNWLTQNSSTIGDGGSLTSNRWWSKTDSGSYNCSEPFHIYCFQVDTGISPTLTPTPNLTPYKVFTTSTTYNGNLGGLTGADNKCQIRAQAAGLSGTYIAWISNSTTSAKDRISDGRYVLIDGSIIANSKNDLTDGAIQNKINKDEFNQLINLLPEMSWTGTTIYGGGSLSCNNWSSADISYNALAGGTNYTDGSWTNMGWWHPNCDLYARLYCFQIPTPPTPTLTPIPTRPIPTDYPRGCYESCQSMCQGSLVCGQYPCQPGKKGCPQLQICYNSSCPYDRTCCQPTPGDTN